MTQGEIDTGIAEMTQGQNYLCTVIIYLVLIEVSKGAEIRNRYNKVPHLTQDTIGKVTNSQLDTTKGNQEASPFPASDHKAQIN